MSERKPEENIPWDWGNLIFMVAYHLALFVSMPIYLYYWSPGWDLLAATGLVYIIGGIGITAGYHRFYSHRAFSPSKWFEPILLAMGTISVQGPVLEWASNHRMHHNHVDEEEDPYSINKGFWYAHILWILKKDPAKEFDPDVVPDLMENGLLTFQKKYYGPLMLAGNLLVIGTVGWALGNWIGALVFVGFLRLFLTHHSTYFINSLAHYWGDRPFSREHSAVNNFIISLLSFGEGYHNFHHTFPADYRNGVRWYQLDITKYFIYLLERLGIVKETRRTDDVAIKKKLVETDCDYLLNRLQRACEEKRDEWREIINEKAETLLSRLKALHELSRKEDDLKEGEEQKALVQQVNERMNQLRNRLRDDFQEWWELSNKIERITPAPAGTARHH